MMRESQQRSNSIINKSQSHLINTQKIHQIYNQYRANDCTLQGLQKVFQIISLFDGLKKDPQNPIIQEKIQQKMQITQEQIVKNKRQSQTYYGNYKFDINKTFMMNKSGSIGMIERKCKFTQKGVLQFENQKSLQKFKEIIGFNSLIEKINAKTNISKLQWLKQGSKYPYRIVLIDKNKAQKGIYFNKVEDAFSVRVYLIEEYRMKVKDERVKEIFQECQIKMENKIVENFYSNLIVKHKQKREQKESVKSKLSQKQQQRSQNNEIKLFNNSNNRSKNMNNQNSYLKDESIFDIDRDSRAFSQFYVNDKRQLSEKNMLGVDSKTQVRFRRETKKIIQGQVEKENKRKYILDSTIEKLKRFNRFNIIELVEKWKQQAYDQEEQNMRREQKQEELELRQASKTMQISDDTQLYSVLDFIRKKNRAQKYSNLDRQKKSLQFENITLRFGQISLVPYKLELSVTILPRRGKSTKLIYNTFQCINDQTTDGDILFYQLVRKNTDSDQHGFEISDKLEKYSIQLELRQTITDQVIGKKQLQMKDIQSFNQKFDIQIIQFKSQSQIPNDTEKTLISCKVSGKLSSKNQKFNSSQNQLINQTKFHQLYQTIINPILLTQQTVKIPNNDNFLNEKEQIKKIMAIIPPLEDDIKLQLQNILSTGKQRPISLGFLSCHIPIQNFSLEPTNQEYTQLDTCYQVLRKTNNIDKVPPSAVHLQILKHLISTQLFDSKLQLLQTFISIILNWSPIFLNPSITYPHISLLMSSLGLAVRITTIQQKLSLIKIITQYLLNKQCPQMIQKLKNKNIPLVLLILDYSQSNLTKIINPKLWLILMVTIFHQNINIPIEICFILIAVFICKLIQDDLEGCNTIQQVKQMIQSVFLHQNNFNKQKQTQSKTAFEKLLERKQYILSYIKSKYQEHFVSKQVMNKIQTLRNTFYTNQSNLLKLKNTQRFAQKTQIIKELPQVNLNLSQFRFNKNNNKPRCLHVYFTKLPKVSGSLYLKTDSTQFQCIEYEKNPYFILPQVRSLVKVEFIDSKSNQYSFWLKIDVGFGYFKQQVKNPKNSQILLFQYWTGLLDHQMLNNKSLTKTKHLEQSLSSFLERSQIKKKLYKKPEQSYIYQNIEKQLVNSYQNGNINPAVQQILRRLKLVFFENEKLNEYELFLYVISNMKGSLREKIFSLFEYADIISEQISLCKDNYDLRRMLMYDLFRLMSIPIDHWQFEAIYQETMYGIRQCQIPQIIQARFYSLQFEKMQINLQKHIHQFMEQSATHYLYSDIDIDELTKFIHPIIVDEIRQKQFQKQQNFIINEGLLSFIVSSNGNVTSHQYKILFKNGYKQILIDQKTLPQCEYQEQLKKLKPKLLTIKGTSKMNKLDTTFSPLKKPVPNMLISQSQSPSKINLAQFVLKPSLLLADTDSNIKSRFKPQSSNINLKSESSNELRTISQDDSQFWEMNLIQYLIPKYKRIIPLRYQRCKGAVMFKDFKLFQSINSNLYAISQNQQDPQIKQIYFNNDKVNSLQFLNCPGNSLHFYTDLNSELVKYKPQIGIQNNLRSLRTPNNNKPTILYFVQSALNNQEKSLKNKTNGKTMVNYGYGVIRWEQCSIIGSFMKRNKKANKKDKMFYLIIVDGNQKITQQKYLKLNKYQNQPIPYIGQITDKNLTKWQQFIL